MWAYLDHQDVWYGLFCRGRDGCQAWDWLQELASSEVHFKRVIKSLLAYSLIESHQHTDSYSLHSVVHDWCIETISCGKSDLMVATLIVVGTATSSDFEAKYWLSQQRLLPHADRCVRHMANLDVLDQLRSVDASYALYNLGLLCVDQGKHVEAEKMYRRALNGYEKARGPYYTSTLDTVNNLGALYAKQGKHVEAEKMYRRPLDRRKKA